MKNRSQLFLFLFFISGTCGLVYEVVWTRLFVVVIGNTVFSVSAVLAVFMAGLALGSRVAGRALDRRPISLIRTYALLEAGIGIYNLLLPVLLKAANPIFGALYSSAFDSFIVLVAARLVIALLFLIIPATLMGATLPILIRFYVENIARVGAEVGRVYTANTWGAAVGATLAGFILVPGFGVTTTLLIAVGANLLIAGVAWSLAGSNDATSTPSIADTEMPGPSVILIAIFISGVAALIDEVAWTRVLSLVVGPTTYAFTLMLTSMIVGLGLGAAIGSRLTTRRTISLSTFAWIEIIVGFTSLAVIPAFGRMPVWIGKIVIKYVEQFGMIQTVEFLIFFGLLLVPTTFLGMTFPIAARLYAKSDSLLGSEVSAVYSFNTVGGIVGSLAAGFLLIPHVGTQSALLIAAAINFGAALLLKPPPSRWVPLVASVVVIPLIVLMPRWNPELMSSGAYKYAPYFIRQADIETALTGGDLVYFKEGATTTVSVRSHNGELGLAVDGKVDATDSGDMTTQKMLGHLPLLLSEAPKNVAVIGLGSGVTAGATLQYPIQSLDVVEISPEVAEASDLFKHVNHDALRDPRTRLIIGDGRNHLRYIPKQYDVIISEPSNPWMSGMASLFTQEFFQESLARLTPNGIHCQWFHSYNMSTDDLRTIVATFRSAFPHAQLWALNENDLLLLGSPSPIPVREDVLKRNFAQAAADLKGIGIVDIYTVASLYMLEDADLDTFSAGATLNTDSHPVLEFHAPRYIYANTSDENYSALTAVQRKVPRPAYVERLIQTATGENHRHKGEMYLTSNSDNDASREFQMAITEDVHDQLAWDGLLKLSVSVMQRPELTKFIDGILAAQPLTVVRLSAAEFYAQAANYTKAIPLLTTVLAEDPKNVAALEQLADDYSEQGNPALQTTVDRLLALEPEDARGLFQLATIRFYQQRLDEAIEIAKRSLAADPANPRARDLLAILYGQTFQHDLAETEFKRAIHDFPKDWLSLNNFGLYLLERERVPEAIVQFQKAIDGKPDNVQAYVGLGEANRKAGRTEEARRWYRIALQFDPNQPVAKVYAQ